MLSALDLETYIRKNANNPTKDGALYLAAAILTQTELGPRHSLDASVVADHFGVWLQALSRTSDPDLSITK